MSAHNIATLVLAALALVSGWIARRWWFDPQMAFRVIPAAMVALLFGMFVVVRLAEQFHWSIP